MSLTELQNEGLSQEKETLEDLPWYVAPATVDVERIVGEWESYYRRKDQRMLAEMIAEGKLGSFPNVYSYYHDRRVKENIPLYEELAGNIDLDSRVAELGIGAGTMTLELSRNGYDCTGLDNEFLFPLFIEHTEALGISVPKLLNADLFYIPVADKTYDLVFSHGTLEHFEDEQIVEAIREALRVSKKFIFVVPTEVDTPENKVKLGLSSSHFGNERYFSVQKWEELINRAGGKIQNKFGYWIPEFGSTKRHPEKPEDYYGKGVFAGYTVTS